MEHSKAVETNAAERYLLGELTVAERDEFEAHYFDCTVCASDVKSGAALIDNAREIFRTEPVPGRDAKPLRRSRGAWFGWLRPAYAAGALAVLLLTVGYQNFVTIPKLRQAVTEGAQTLPTLSLMTAGTRGEEVATIEVASGKPFGIFLDIPTAGGFVSYVCEVRTEGGEKRLTVPVSAGAARDSVQLLIPGGLLTPGKYVVSVRGTKAGGDEELARYPFRLNAPQ